LPANSAVKTTSAGGESALSAAEPEANGSVSGEHMSPQHHQRGHSHSVGSTLPKQPGGSNTAGPDSLNRLRAALLDAVGHDVAFSNSRILGRGPVDVSAQRETSQQHDISQSSPSAARPSYQALQPARSANGDGRAAACRPVHAAAAEMTSAMPSSGGCSGDGGPRGGDGSMAAPANHHHNRRGSRRGSHLSATDHSRSSVVPGQPHSSSNAPPERGPAPSRPRGRLGRPCSASAPLQRPSGLPSSHGRGAIPLGLEAGWHSPGSPAAAAASGHGPPAREDTGQSFQGAQSASAGVRRTRPRGACGRHGRPGSAGAGNGFLEEPPPLALDAQPQMALIEGIHDGGQLWQATSIGLPAQVLAPVAGNGSLVPVLSAAQHQAMLLDPVAQPQMASIEGWLGPPPVLERLPGSDRAASPRHLQTSPNPATSVHATVVMDGNISEGDTDLSSMRLGSNAEVHEPDAVQRAICGATQPASNPAVASHCGSWPALLQGLFTDPSLQQNEWGSGLEAMPMVHPAASVHATVGVAGTISGEDVELSSMLQEDSVPDPDEAMPRSGGGENCQGVEEDALADPRASRQEAPGSGAGGFVSLEASGASRGGHRHSDPLAFAANSDGNAGSKSKAHQARENSGVGQANGAHGRINTAAVGSTKAKSSCHDLQPVHPATSVHATVMMDVTHSGDNTDGSSMVRERRRRRPANNATMQDPDHGACWRTDREHPQSPTLSMVAPALATYIGDCVMQPDSRAGTMSGGSHSMSAGAAQRRRNRPLVASSPDGPAEAQVVPHTSAAILDETPPPRNSPQELPGADPLGEDGAMPMVSDAEGPHSCSAPALSPGRHNAVQGPPADAAVSGTAGVNVQQLAAAATMDGSPQLDMRWGPASHTQASSDHNARGPQAEVGSGTLHAGQPGRGQGAVIEDITDQSSLQLCRNQVVSVESMASAGAADACQHESLNPTPVPSVKNSIPDSFSPAASGLQNACTHEFSADDKSKGEAGSQQQDNGAMDCRSGPQDAEEDKDANAGGIGMTSGFEQPQSTSRPAGIVAPQGAQGLCSEHNDQQHHNARAANSGTSPSYHLGNGSTDGTVVAAVPASAVTTAAVHSSDSKGSNGDGNGPEEGEAQGPSAAQMAAAATAAAAAMSATAGTLLAEGLPPRPRGPHTKGLMQGADPGPSGTAANHSLPGGMRPSSSREGRSSSPHVASALAQQSGSKQGGVSGSHKRRTEWQATSNGTIDDGHLHGMAQRLHSYWRSQSLALRANECNSQGRTWQGNRMSATSQQHTAPRPALTVVAPFGAVAGLDSPYANCTSPRTYSSHDRTGMGHTRAGTSREQRQAMHFDGQNGDNLSGLANMHSCYGCKLSHGSDCNSGKSRPEKGNE